MKPDGSGWVAEDDWRTAAWSRFGEVPSLDDLALSELDRALLTRGSVAVLHTVEPSGSGEPRERG